MSLYKAPQYGQLAFPNSSNGRKTFGCIFHFEDFFGGQCAGRSFFEIRETSERFELIGLTRTYHF